MKPIYSTPGESGFSLASQIVTPFDFGNCMKLGSLWDRLGGCASAIPSDYDHTRSVTERIGLGLMVVRHLRPHLCHYLLSTFLLLFLVVNLLDCGCLFETKMDASFFIR